MADTKPRGADQKAQEKREEDNRHEKAVEDSFPASDPPSTSAPEVSVGWEGPEDDKKP